MCPTICTKVLVVQKCLKIELIRTGVKLADGKLHHLCVTWKSFTGVLTVQKNGNLMISISNVRRGEIIKRRGTWWIGQDQDSGPTFGFQKKHSFKGMITKVNIWDRVLTNFEIQFVGKNCGPLIKGNLKEYSDFKMFKAVKFIQRPPCCPICTCSA